MISWLPRPRRDVRVALPLSVFLLAHALLPASGAVAQGQDGNAEERKQKRVYTNDDWPFNLPRQPRQPPQSPSSGDQQRPGEPSGQASEEGKKLAPYVPTPLAVVEKMLAVAGVGPGDVVYDLGSGDGRVVIVAAQKYGAKGVGVELDHGLARESAEKVRELKLGSLVTIIEGDMLKTDVKPATVVTVYLLPSANEQLRPILERDLAPGSRVVAHDMNIPGWKAVQEEAMQVDGATHFVYLYRMPEAFRP
ncbi:MAG: class I SAM-dependent methyltransferase [Acidobacteria bacterium]|nr:class I SAM-dependent methyltransferase [Acidobacteriota bacterium]